MGGSDLRPFEQLIAGLMLVNITKYLEAHNAPHAETFLTALVKCSAERYKAHICCGVFVQ